MINYDEALEIAQKYKKNINICIEYEKGFAFGSSEDTGYEGGYGHTTVVILKETGKVTKMPEFVMNGTGKEIGQYQIDCGGVEIPPIP
ncbi:hypothetical protein [Ruminococcus flavefaciens]|uniref:hypothetical protein n=1 Tax=Ruminococcus flavefaciens TaxID=1265 RepID=UPI000490A98F|nr:hypothetical protein [Ruminococcus flavefaciens]